MSILTKKEIKGDCMKEYSKWKDEEVIKLFKFIEDGKKNNVCLSKLFKDYAKLTNRMPNSVRNYYYAELTCLENDANRRKELKIDIDLHKKVTQKEFTYDETKKLVLEILKQTSKGISVRKACLNLANGNINDMVRYQNKFRTVVIKDKELYESCIDELKKGGLIVKGKLPDNIVSMPERRTLLTESDINSLFLGLVKLVKKQAIEQAGNSYKRESEKANEMLRKTLIELTEKDNELKILRKKFKVLNTENYKLMEEIKLLRGKNAELINKHDKLLKLKNFATKNNNTIQQSNNV